jgi:hypothetical protein
MSNLPGLYAALSGLYDASIFKLPSYPNQALMRPDGDGLIDHIGFPA